jgi:hypothetical protein
MSIDHDKVSLMTEIDSLRRGWLACEAERDALAALVVELRGALEERDAQIDHLFRHSGRQGSEDYDALEVSAAWARLRSPMPALSLPLPAAAERVKEWREKADLLDWAAEQKSTIYYCWAEDRDEDNYRSVGQHEAPDHLSALRAARGAQ